MAPELFGCHDRLSSKSCFCFGVCAGLHGAFLVRGVRVRRGGLVGHTGLGRGLSRGVLLCSALGVRFVQRLRDQVQHEVSLGELFAVAERLALQVTLDALEEFFGNLEYGNTLASLSMISARKTPPTSLTPAHRLLCRPS